jgi:MraZ protein
MLIFTGQYDVKVDAKGRLKLPVDLLRQVPEDTRRSYVLNKGLDKCLRLYPLTQWKEVTTEMAKNLSYFKNQDRAFMRYFNQGASNVELDGADRILINKGLKDLVGIKDEVVIYAFNDAIEIWSSEEYYASMKEPENFADMADEIWSKLSNNK